MPLHIRQKRIPRHQTQPSHRHLCHCTLSGLAVPDLRDICENNGRALPVLVTQKFLIYVSTERFSKHLSLLSALLLGQLHTTLGRVISTRAEVSGSAFTAVNRGLIDAAASLAPSWSHTTGRELLGIICTTEAVDASAIAGTIVSTIQSGETRIPRLRS
jgi:hypothetical protein